VRRLRAAVRQRLRRALAVRDWSGAKLFGSGGTFTNLARVAAVRERGAAPAGGVHGSTVSLPALHRILEWLSTLSLEERRSVGGLNPERADIIVAGLAVAAEVLGRFDAPKITVSAFGLREGLLLHLAGPPEGEQRPSRAKALRRFADRCRTDRRHTEQVLRLARQLFDRLGKRLGCAAGEWDLLEGAALLHDVGQLVSYRGHHKHSYHLIAHAESLPYAARERLLIAVISRYHRKRPPTKRHPEFAALEPAERATVRRLAALLRVADGLDRGHVAAVEAMRLRVLPTKLLIEVAPRLATTDLKLELWGASRKADLLEKLLKREVAVRTAAIAEANQAAS
jgi:exopolyphosphatase/guanosine-5'-triphosphate,3'-diphosphate pyrophosphatase